MHGQILRYKGLSFVEIRANTFIRYVDKMHYPLSLKNDKHEK